MVVVVVDEDEYSALSGFRRVNCLVTTCPPSEKTGELLVGGNNFLKAEFIVVVVAEGLQRWLDLEDGLQAEGE